MNNVEAIGSEKRTVQDTIEEMIKTLEFGWIRLVHETEEQEMDDWAADSSSDYIRWAGAKIIGVREDEYGEEGERVEIGHISGRLMMFAKALNDGQDIWDQADSMDGDAEGAASVLKSFYDSDERYSFGGTGLVVEEVFLKPAYRGHELGALLLRRYIDWHGPDVFAVVTYPNADHFFHRNDPERAHHIEKDDPLFGANVGVGDKKLRAWCERLGFEKDPKYDNYFVLDVEGYDHRWRSREVGRKNRKTKKAR